MTDTNCPTKNRTKSREASAGNRLANLPVIFLITMLDRDYKFGRVVGWFIDKSGYRVGGHIVSWVWLDEGEQVFGSLRRSVQPFGVVTRVQDDGHAIVYRRHEFVGLGGDDCAGLYA